ncbi:hypothetical protein F5Y03DRAFT_223273 [Xylaria venustula]|nr:hypothetical protein F5Y03DRAFT_223273 [Xylaria venustula]
MPYADNMYSMGEDSDGEDYTNQLSPSDGQFPSSSSNETPHVPNVFIPDPTLQQREERGDGSKAQEAEEDRLLNSHADSSHQSSEPFSRLSRIIEQATTAISGLSSPHRRDITYSQSSAAQISPQVYPSRAWSPSVYSEAPPAYSPSPVSPNSSGIPSQQDRPRNYNTFGISHTMGTPEVESERLLGSQPESMSAPVDGEGGGAPAWARRARRRLPTWLNWKYGLLASIILIVSIVFLSGVASHRKENQQPAPPTDKEPEGQVPNDPESPGWNTFCQGEQHRYDDQILSVDFERTQNLTFTESAYLNRGSSSVRVGGQVVVRRLTKGAGDPRVVVEIVTNEPGLRLFTTLDAEAQTIKVSVPEKYESSVPGQRPCVELKGTVWVPEDAEMGILFLRSIHLDILLLDDLSLHVADHTELSSVVGNIKAGASEPASRENNSDDVPSGHDHKFVPAKDSWAFDSRVIEVHTTAGNIEGNWPLFDSLGLHTTSGTIQVSITPEEELEHYPKPAALSLGTISGVISAAEPIHDLDLIPHRDYLTNVTTTSGTVNSSLAFSSGITVLSTAGTLTLDLLPVINIDKIHRKNLAQLTTTATSGKVSVSVLEPKFYDDNGRALSKSKQRALDCLEATHTFTSGNLDLHYPQSWEGTLTASTTSGRLVAKGKDLKIIKSADGWPGSHLEARKGAAGKKSTINVHGLFGNLDALIGDEP